MGGMSASENLSGILCVGAGALSDAQERPSVILLNERMKSSCVLSFPPCLLSRCPTQLVMCVLVTQSCPTPWTVAHQAPLSVEFPKQKYWSGLPFPSPGESSRPRDQTHVSFTGRCILYHWATREAPQSIRDSHNWERACVAGI